MESSEKTESGEIKRKGARIPIALKKEMVAKYENGTRVSDLAAEYNMSKSTICTILRRKEMIKNAKVATGALVLTKQRPQAVEYLERLLLIWANHKLLAGEIVNEPLVREKARQLWSDLTAKHPEMCSDTDVFKASRGWYDKFKKRSGLRNLIKDGEGTSKSNDDFAKEFNEWVKAEGYLPQQVFNCDQTSLFWKRMPQKTYLSIEGKAQKGFRPMNDKVTVLLCGNASGDYRVKPMVVYHSVYPRAFKKNNVGSKKLPVLWRSNSRGWITRQFFLDWIHEVFAPDVHKYLEENNLPQKCLLVMDSAPSHTSDLVDDLLDDLEFIKIKILPPKVTPFVQPMKQNVITTFKKHFTKSVFQKCYDATFETGLDLREFWKRQYNILHCVYLIPEAWQQISEKTINSSWSKLWPECVKEENSEYAETENSSLIEEIVKLGEKMDLDVCAEDVMLLMEDTKSELTTEELEKLQKDQEKEMIEEVKKVPVVDDKRQDLATELIAEICTKWTELQSFVELYHPDKELAGCSAHIVNDHAISYFRNILMSRLQLAND